MTSILNKNIEEWGIVTSINEGSPKADIKQVFIPGRDTPIDYSDALTGDICYSGREMEIVLAIIEEDTRVAKAKVNEIKNHCHGKKGRIILPDEREYYYEGRVMVSSERIDSKLIEVTFEVIANPYKKKEVETIVSRTVAGTDTIICNNLRQRVIPTIVTTSSMTISFKGKSYSVEAGTHLLDLVLEEGENVFEITGTGSITFKYREGSL